MRSIVLFIIAVIILIILVGSIYSAWRASRPSPPVFAPEKTIRIIEGWNIKDIAEYLETQGTVTRKKFIEEADKYASSWRTAGYDFLADKPQGLGLEGYLFPDTYRIYQDATAEDIIKKMLDNFDKKLTWEMRQEIKNQEKTIFEIITLASLVEKEAAKDEDRQIVADIFYKRLNLGQPLQSCATINYILGTKKPQLSFEETRTPSPYNTYLNLGLPPGPICSPGLSSIKAVIWPKKTDYWYFLSKPDGEMVFSRTKEEHDINKAKYLK